MAEHRLSNVFYYLKKNVGSIYALSLGWVHQAESGRPNDRKPEGRILLTIRPNCKVEFDHKAENISSSISAQYMGLCLGMAWLPFQKSLGLCSLYVIIIALCWQHCIKSSHTEQFINNENEDESAEDEEIWILENRRELFLNCYFYTYFTFSQILPRK